MEDDSIIDFKSPKKIHPNLNPTLRKPTLNKKLQNKKNKPTTIKRQTVCSSKVIKNSSSTQPTVQSLFFKSKNQVDLEDDKQKVSKSHVCPLCLKIIKDEVSHATHVKSCAIQHKISTVQVLSALELQEKQTAERQALGLPVIPPLEEKKVKKPKSKNLDCDEDYNYKLGLALSESLYESEISDELNEVNLLCNTENNIPLEKNSNNYSTLQNFGLKIKKNIKTDHPIVRSRKKKLLEPTILQNRSQEERNRLLTERISEVLIDNDNLTQNTETNKNFLKSKQQDLILKSHLLNCIHQKEKKLWNIAKLHSNNDFYVPTLAKYIEPIMDKIENIYFDDNNKSSSSENFKFESSIAFVNVKEEMPSNNNQFINSLIHDWKNMLNKSAVSDVIIFVGGNKHIWTHKLIFFVRCKNMLLDVAQNNNPNFSTAKEQINLTDYTFDGVLYFLEFLYCGSIENYNIVINNNNLLSEIRRLARKYKVKELFAYLKEKEINFNDMKDDYSKDNKDIQISSIEKSGTVNISIAKDNVKDLSNEKSITTFETFHSESENEKNENDISINENNYKDHELVERESLSPDIFADSINIIEEKVDDGFEQHLKKNNQFTELEEVVKEQLDKEIMLSSLNSSQSENKSPSSPIKVVKESENIDNAQVTISSESEISTEVEDNPYYHSKEPMSTSGYIDLIKRCNTNSEDEEAYKALQQCLPEQNMIKKVRKNPFKRRHQEILIDSICDKSFEEQTEPLAKKTSALSMLDKKPYDDDNYNKPIADIKSPIPKEKEDLLMISLNKKRRLNDDKNCDISHHSKSIKTLISQKYKRNYHSLSSTPNSDANLSTTSILNLWQNKSESEERITDNINSTSFLKQLEEFSANPSVNNSYNDKSLNVSPISIHSSLELNPETFEFDKMIETDVFLDNRNEHVQEDESQAIDTLKISCNLKRNKSFSNKSSESNDFIYTETVNKKENQTDHLLDKKYLKRKSKSEGNLIPCNINSEEEEITISKHDTLLGDYDSFKDIIISKYDVCKKDITAPDYNLMSTPDLEKEAKKYGLKKLNRSRTVKLLTCIFEELHPLIAYFSSSEDEDSSNPPSPEIYRLNNHSIQSLNDADTVEKSSETKRAKSSVKERTKSCDTFIDKTTIKEKLYKLLIEDTELYNQILQYNSIDLSWLFNFVKAKGLKCKLPDLMDFLDDQCITFIDTVRTGNSKK